MDSLAAKLSYSRVLIMPPVGVFPLTGLPDAASASLNPRSAARRLVTAGCAKPVLSKSNGTSCGP